MTRAKRFSPFGNLVLAAIFFAILFSIGSPAAAQLVYSKNFQQGASYFPGSPQYDDWETFRASIPTSGVNSITISGSRDPVGRTCTDPVKAQAICDAMRAGAAGRSGVTYTVFSDGFHWNVGSCSNVNTDANNLELNVSPTVNMCSCSSDNYTIRPGITGGGRWNNSNWGGIAGPTCNAPTQTITVTIDICEPATLRFGPSHSHQRAWLESGYVVSNLSHLHLHSGRLFQHLTTPDLFRRVDGAAFSVKRLFVSFNWDSNSKFVASNGAVLNVPYGFRGWLTFPSSFSNITHFNWYSRSMEIDNVELDTCFDENEAPKITCPAPTTHECDGNASATVVLSSNVSDADGDTLTVKWIIDGVVKETDIVNGGVGTATFSHTYPVGTTTLVTVSVTDGEDSDACSTTVTVVDTGFPTIICAPNVTFGTDPGKCEALVLLSEPEIADNCEVVDLTNNAPAENIYPLGDTDVTWTVTDAGGNTATCVQTVTIVDLEAPKLTCPADVSVVHDPGFCDAKNVDLGSATTSDNCGTPVVTNDAPVAFALGLTMVTWTATDGAGNSTSCVQWVRVTNEGPTANAGDDLIVECTSSAGELLTLDGTASSDPDDPFASLSLLWTAPAGISFDDPTLAEPTAFFPHGSTTVTLQVTDPCGATSSTDVIIVVEDTTAPQIQAAVVDQRVLWSPNHKMIPVAVSLLVRDTCENPEDLILLCEVTSNEPDDANGDGAFTGDVDGQDGFSSPVAVSLSYNSVNGNWEGTVLLRAERDGGGDGRKYSIECKALDSSNNFTTATACVTVPKSQKGGKK